MAFLNFFKVLTSFELIDYDMVVQKLNYIPEQTPFSLNFYSAGYETSLFLVNAASWLFSFSALCSIELIIMLIAGLFGLFSRRASWLSNRIRNHIFWYGTIRFFMESYLEIVLVSFINIKIVDK